MLGSGERLFDGFEAGKPALEIDRVLEAPGVVHFGTAFSDEPSRPAAFGG